MSDEYVIGLDIGTSAIKGVLLSVGGTIAAHERKSTRYLPDPTAPGIVQFDANDLYGSVLDVIRRLVSALPAGGQVAALSMASASGNTVLVDDQGEPIVPAISWMDTRVQGEMERVFGSLDAEQVHEVVGWPYLPMFPLAHLSWLKCHQPEALAGAARICMSTDYILYKLTGNWAVDHSTATTFYLQDQKKADWHLPYLDPLGIAREKLPPIHPAGTVIGTVTASAATQSDLRPGTAVVLGAFDHPCAARGSGIVEEGQLLLSCGTSWVGFFPTYDRRKAIAGKLLVDPFLQPEGAWGAMFSLPAIATAIDKHLDQFIPNGADRYQEFDRLATASSPGAGGLLINPMLDRELIPERGYSKEDRARALMEGTAFLLKMQVDKLQAAGLSFASVTMVGGPTESVSWPQIVADILGTEVITINGSNAGAVGAAILAGIGAGFYRDERHAHQKLTFPQVVRSPNPACGPLYKEQYKRFVDTYQ